MPKYCVVKADTYTDRIVHFCKKVAIKHCKRVICIKKIVSKKIIHHFVVLYMNSIYFCNITIKQMIMKKYHV